MAGTQKFVIGVDGGTTAVKAVAFTLDGAIASTVSRGVPVEYGSHGEAEQDMNAIWEAAAHCLRGVVAEIGPDAEIVGIGLTGQGDGLWLVDVDGTPIKKAATWLDGRAAERVERWTDEGRAAAVLETTGTSLFPGLAPVLLAELGEKDPELLGRAAHLLYCKDWLRYRLTGEIRTDFTEASRTFLKVADTSGYSDELAGRLGLAGALDLLPEIHGADAPGGVVSEAAAEVTGVPAGTPVGIGMIDVAVTGAGLGAVEDGEGWLILGTTGFVGTLRGSVAERTSEQSMVLATGRGTQVLEFLAPMTGTPALDWIRSTLNRDDNTWAEIEAEAGVVPVGSNGVLYHPYASPGGERAPFQDTAASASWMGMSITTTPSDILRSVYEGIAFSLVECIDELRVDHDLVVSGGGFRSDLMCQIIADTTGRRVVRQDAPEAGARGAAVLALVSAGEVADVATAAQMLATKLSTFEADAENTVAYRRAHEVYVESRNAIQPVWPRMRELRA
ncbi:MAG: FGGY family carbohydrate kinase [Actinomycetaceae bacterium]